MLAEIKADEELKRIPVVILTVSRVEEDINISYDLHANCYLTKPIDFGDLMETLAGVLTGENRGR